MSANSLEYSGFQSTVRGAITTAWRENRPLSLLVLGSLALLVASIIGLVIDPRIITGAPAWMKPAKFGISVVIYGATLLWLLTFLKDRPRFVAIVSWLALLGFGIELALIAMQVVRGTTSHFNRQTPFDGRVWDIMAVVIVGMWMLTLIVAVLLFRRQFAAPAIVWGVRMGLIAALLGMAVAFLMPRPTPAQDVMFETTGSSPIVGAHSVGVPDGGPGLPIVGWSTTGGDLRVAHFIGLHGLQALLLIGWLLARFGPSWLSARGRAQLTIVAGLAWIGLTLLLTWQARRAQPLTAPDGTTLLAFGALLGATAVIAALVLVLNAERASRQVLRG
jgi:hypothetical protein